MTPSSVLTISPTPDLVFQKRNRPPVAECILRLRRRGAPPSWRLSPASCRRLFGCMAWLLKSASSPEEDLARCRILPPRWRRSPKKKGKGIKIQTEASTFPASHQRSASEHRQDHTTWFRDAGNAEADAGGLPRRGVAAAVRGGQVVVGDVPVAPTKPARRAGHYGIIPLQNIPALVVGPVEAIRNCSGASMTADAKGQAPWLFSVDSTVTDRRCAIHAHATVIISQSLSPRPGTCPG